MRSDLSVTPFSPRLYQFAGPIFHLIEVAVQADHVALETTIHVFDSQVQAPEVAFILVGCTLVL